MVPLMRETDLRNDDQVSIRLPRAVVEKLEADAYPNKLKGAAPLLRLMALERYGLLPPGVEVPKPQAEARS